MAVGEVVPPSDAKREIPLLQQAFYLQGQQGLRGFELIFRADDIACIPELARAVFRPGHLRKGFAKGGGAFGRPGPPQVAGHPRIAGIAQKGGFPVGGVFFAGGAKRVHAPAGASFFIDAGDADRIDELIPRANVKPGKISITSAHLMGGCAMGRDASDSVTDGWGRVHGAPWLFVADSSLFPMCSEVNPYVTVMALADKVAEGIRTNAGELLS